MPIPISPGTVVLALAVSASLLVFLHLLYLAFLYERALHARSDIPSLSIPLTEPTTTYRAPDASPEPR